MKDEEIARRLKDTRLALGKSQEAMAVAVGGKLRSWQDYEKGRSIPGGAVLAQLGRLGVNMNWVLTGEGAMFAHLPGAEPPTPIPAAPPDLDMLRDIVRQLAELMEEEGLRPRPDRFADLVVAVYEQQLAESRAAPAAQAQFNAGSLRGFLRLVR